LKKFTFGLLSIVLLFSTLSLLGSGKVWIFSLFEHFRHIYFLIALIASLYASTGLILSKKRIGYLILTVLGVITLSINFSIFRSNNNVTNVGHSNSSQPLKIFIHNIHRNNNAYQEYQQQLINHFKPDIIALFEVTPEFIKETRDLSKNYPYKIELPSNDNYGFLILSKYEISDWSIIEDEDIPVTIHLFLPQKKIKIFFVHLPPPIVPDLWDIQNRTLVKMTSQIKKDHTPVIVAGDFNLTPWSFSLNKFANDSGLNIVNASKINFSATWPSPLSILPIDHVFSSIPLEVQIGPTLKSDHHSLIVYY